MSGHTEGKRGCSFIRSSDGASALEFALVAPVLLALLFGMIEFGFAFQAQLAVTHAAREGVRMAAVRAESDWDQALVESRALPLAPVTATRTFPDSDSVSVTVSHEYEWKVLPLGAPIQLMSTATMRRE
ncbi:MAG: TadE/TadG family type IV pilus assembly protein [Anaerosomatales bacterium]